MNKIHPLALIALLGGLLIVFPLTLLIFVLWLFDSNSTQASGSLVGLFVLGVASFMWALWIARD